MLAVSLLFGWLRSVECKLPLGERRGDLVCGVEVGADVLGGAMAGRLRSAWRDCAVSIDNQVVGEDRHCLFERGRLSKDTGGVDPTKGVQIEGAVRQQEANKRSSNTSVECRWPMPSSVPSLDPRVTLPGLCLPAPETVLVSAAPSGQATRLRWWHAAPARFLVEAVLVDRLRTVAPWQV